MNSKKHNPKINKAEKTSAPYEISKIKFKGIDRATFDLMKSLKMV